MILDLSELQLKCLFCDSVQFAFPEKLNFVVDTQLVRTIFQNKIQCNFLTGLMK